MQDYYSEENFNKLLDGTREKIYCNLIFQDGYSDQVNLLVDMTLLWFKEKVSHLKKVQDVIKFVRVSQLIFFLRTELLILNMSLIMIYLNGLKAQISLMTSYYLRQ